jgi:rubrerythrin
MMDFYRSFQRDAHPPPTAWSIAQVPCDPINVAEQQSRPWLFYVLVSASFLEITSEHYAGNLLELFREDAEISEWLSKAWQSEELQHGFALRAYVQQVWPDFDWDAAYRIFFAEFTQHCTPDELAPTPALELVARCVIETGTASFYRMLSEASPEPVLKQLAGAISTDEVRHYKHFYRHLTRYRRRGDPGRIAVLHTLLARIGEINAEDAFYAFKHAYCADNPGAHFSRATYTAFRGEVRALARDHFPHRMATKMLLGPLNLSPPVSRVTFPAVAWATRLLCMGRYTASSGHRPRPLRQ